MAAIHFGPARVPSRETPEAAIDLLLERGYDACEVDFEGGFWMDYPWAERFGQLARDAGIVLSVHAPIAGFMGHAERGKKLNMAVGMLDHSAGIAVAAGEARVQQEDGQDGRHRERDDETRRIAPSGHDPSLAGSKRANPGEEQPCDPGSCSRDRGRESRARPR